MYTLYKTKSEPQCKLWTCTLNNAIENVEPEQKIAS